VHCLPLKTRRKCAAAVPQPACLDLAAVIKQMSVMARTMAASTRATCRELAAIGGHESFSPSPTQNPEMLRGYASNEAQIAVHAYFSSSRAGLRKYILVFVHSPELAGAMFVEHPP
jgi:hypothetical protein